MNPASKSIQTLRRVALAEAVSYLILLFIAMPLKYIWSMPLAVKITGSIHGLLFVIFCVALARAWHAAAWPLMRVALIFIASLLPFVPFWMDRRAQAWQAEAA